MWPEVVDSGIDGTCLVVRIGARVSPCDGEGEVMADAEVVTSGLCEVTDRGSKSGSLLVVVMDAVPGSGVVLVAASAAPSSAVAGAVVSADGGIGVVAVAEKAVPPGVVVGAVIRLVRLKLLKNATRA